MSQIDFDPYVKTTHGNIANITSMRLIDPSNPEVMNIMAEWGLMETNIGRSPLLGMRAMAVRTSDQSGFSPISEDLRSLTYEPQFLFTDRELCVQTPLPTFLLYENYGLVNYLPV